VRTGRKLFWLHEDRVRSAATLDKSIPSPRRPGLSEPRCVSSLLHLGSGVIAAAPMMRH